MRSEIRSAAGRSSAGRARLALRGALWAALCVVGVPLLVAAPTSSVEAQQAPTKEEKKRAGQRFREGEALFQKHAYAESADAFEDAYRIAPHPSVLWNAVNAAALAGQNARAATLAARLVAEKSKGDEKLIEQARQKLAELRPRVGRVEIGGATAEKVELDGKVVRDPELYVEPGDHELTATVGGAVQRRKVTVVAGAMQRVLLDAPAAAAASDVGPRASASAVAAPTPVPAGEQAPEQASKPPGKGLSPVVTYVGGGLTLVSAGVLVWSGLDTLDARKKYDEGVDRSAAAVDEGKQKQLRTNVLAGVTGVVGLATLGVALFATDWGRGGAQVGVGPGGVTLRGAF